MTQLHEIIAVEPEVKRISDETAAMFRDAMGRSEFFFGAHRTYKPFNEEDTDIPPDEQTEMATTVPRLVGDLKESLARYWDVVLQKEETNCDARADIIVDGKVLVKNVPVTFLLGLERKLAEYRGLLTSIPTLPSGVRWERDPEKGEGVYRQETPDQKSRTRKTFDFRVLYPATDKHPAQIEKWEDQRPVGTFTTERTAGCMSRGEKAVMLARLDKLAQAVKQARQRGNTQDVQERTVAKELLAFVHGE